MSYGLNVSRPMGERLKHYAGHYGIPIGAKQIASDLIADGNPVLLG